VFFLHSTSAQRNNASAQKSETAEMEKVKLSFMLDEAGTPVYAVDFDGGR